MKIPAVTIKYNKYLDEYVTFFLENSKRAKDSGWGAWKKKNENDIIKKVIAFQGAWKNHSKNILSSLQEILDLEFKKNNIPVYIVNAVNRTVSDPIIIGSNYSLDGFIDMLTHEIIHVLISDNLGQKHKKLKEFYKKTYPESEFDETYSHILVYAVHSKIYHKYFPDRKDVDIKRSAKHGNRGYSIAWDIVTREGSDNIISEFKKWNKKTAPHIVRR